MDGKEGPLDVGAIKAQLEADRQERVEFFTKYLQAGLERFNCDLRAIPHINQDGRIVAVMQVVAKEV